MYKIHAENLRRKYMDSGHYNGNPDELYRTMWNNSVNFICPINLSD